MDQRFPLHASMPRSSSSQRTDSLPASIVPGSSSPSPIPDSEHPSHRSTSPLQSPGSLPAIAPVPFPVPPPLSYDNPSLYRNNLLPPTIPNLEQPTPLTNPLPFQHDYRSQVPVDGEYPVIMPSQDDAILSAPPPYSRYAAGAPPKSESEMRRPQLEMIDVNAAVRGLPTVHIAVGPNGDVTSTNSTLPGSNAFPADPYAVQNSNTDLSLQSAQRSTFSTNSNRFLMRGGMSEKRRKKEKSKDNKRVCGIKLWWVLLAAALISILLSVVLGVTLGLVLKQNQKSKNGPPPYSFPSDDNSQNSVFPINNFPVPLKLVQQSRTCLADNTTLPGFTGQVSKVLWSCDLPHQLQFQIRPNDLRGDSFPQPILPARAGSADEVELLITSIDGGPKPMGPNFDGAKPSIYEGVQPPSFFHQPLHRASDGGTSTTLRQRGSDSDSGSRNAKYEFRVLHTKKIVLRLETIERLLNNAEYLTGHALDMGVIGIVNATRIGAGETVWWCDWEKTYLEGTVWMDPGLSGGSAAAVRMTIQEERLSDRDMQALFPGSGSDTAKGEVTCRKKMVGSVGDLVDVPVGRVGSGESLGVSSGEVTKAELVSVNRKREAEAVEGSGSVKRRFRVRRGTMIRKRDEVESKPIERSDGIGGCLCGWRSV